MFKQSFIVKNSQFYLINYIVSILNIYNFYQLPSYSGIKIKFFLNEKQKKLLLIYISLFKYIFNKNPKIKIGVGVLNDKKPKYLVLELNNIDRFNFFNNFLVSYHLEEIISSEFIKFITPVYKGNCCRLLLKDFFLMDQFLTILLLYKNEGLNFFNDSILECNFMFKTYVNLWNWYYLKVWLKLLLYDRKVLRLLGQR